MNNVGHIFVKGGPSRGGRSAGTLGDGSRLAEGTAEAKREKDDGNDENQEARGVQEGAKDELPAESHPLSLN